MEAQELARLAGINRDSLYRFEHGERTMRPAALARVRTILEERGVAFTFTRDGKPLGIEDHTHTQESMSRR
jgi:hypothetical protein